MTVGTPSQHSSSIGINAPSYPQQQQQQQSAFAAASGAAAAGAATRQQQQLQQLGVTQDGSHRGQMSSGQQQQQDEDGSGADYERLQASNWIIDWTQLKIDVNNRRMCIGQGSYGRVQVGCYNQTGATRDLGWRTLRLLVGGQGRESSVLCADSWWPRACVGAHCADITPWLQLFVASHPPPPVPPPHMAAGGFRQLCNTAFQHLVCFKPPPWY
jgi:hypothetical protein